MNISRNGTLPSLQVIDATTVSELLEGREPEIVDQIRSAYIEHYEGQSCLPHSVFLRFPENSRNRIIGLPAYLGGEHEAAGFKWIASFPANIGSGLDRASALMVLNSMQTGYPKAVMESSIISAKRTAASAALSTRYLLDHPLQSMGLIGCGLIGLEIVHFIKALNPTLKQLVVFDLSAERASHFCDKLALRQPDIAVSVATSADELFARSAVVALATTSAAPYLDQDNIGSDTRLILNVSLRDLAPDVIQSGVNIVDDIDHVCRENTSIHLTEAKVGHRDFIHGTLAQVILGEKSVPQNSAGPVIFSPFGLGVLDLVLAEYVYARSMAMNSGSQFQHFFPVPWSSSNADGKIDMPLQNREESTNNRYSPADPDLSQQHALLEHNWPPVLPEHEFREELAAFLKMKTEERQSFLKNLRADTECQGQFIQKSLSEIYAYWLGYQDSPLYLTADDTLEADILSAKLLIEREMLDHWLCPEAPPKIENQLDACLYLRNYIEQNSGIYHAFFEFVKRDMSREQMLQFLQFEAVRNEVVDDEVALIVVGMQGQMKNAMAANLWDECGNGGVTRFHTHWLRQLLNHLGGIDEFCQERSSLIPWFTGITSNSFNMMATRPGYKYRAFGSFLITESWVNAHFERILEGMRRLDLVHPDLTIYFSKHHTIDPHHTDQILEAMAHQQPRLGEKEIQEVLWGAHTAVAAGTRLYQECMRYFVS